jgi:zinc protease
MRHLKSLTMVWALLAGSATADLSVPVTEFDLPNGLHVILHQDRRVPLITTNLWYFVGSANEKEGRTGFAHLFEHLLFEGSGHVAEGEFDTLLEERGGNNNGSTTSDRTNYYITLPSNSLDLALFLESDRMGYLLDSMSAEVVDGQREVVKNERRQSYENRPYGMANLRLGELLYPPDHPYHWPVIGYVPDLDAAGYDDVVGFYKTYYTPNNASLVVAGDIDLETTRAQVEKWFSDVPAGPATERIQPTPVRLEGVKRETMYDDVGLPRLYLNWLTPALLQPGDAEMDVLANLLAGGKNSRLYKRLVYDMQAAQDVSAAQNSEALSSSFSIVVEPRPGHTVEEMLAVVDEEIERLQSEPPTERELQRSLNGLESAFLSSLEDLEGKADALNAYYMATGTPDYFAQDLARYQALKPEDIQAAAKRYLPSDARVELIVLPNKEEK